MSSKIPDENIRQHNAHFVEGLSGKEWIGVDKNGKLYAVKGVFQSLVFLCASKFFQQGLKERVHESLEESLAEKKTEWLRNDPIEGKKAFYDSLIKSLSATGALSSKDQLFLITDYYDERYGELLKEGNKPFAAESIVTIEMSQDPYVPQSVKNSVKPQLTPTGANGTYIVKDRQGKNIGIFKPMDEEDQMPNNPRGREAAYDPEHPIRAPYRGHLQGTGWKKEIAAFLIDRDRVFDVPETVQISVPFPRVRNSSESIVKQGSLQRFVQGESLDKLEYDQIIALPASEVQKIVGLDAIIGNGDRNFGNCFIQKEQQKLIPIDHGFSLLDSADWRADNPKPRSEMNCHLGALPQLEQPMPEELARWILALDADEIAATLRNNLDFAQTSLQEFKIRLMIFQKALEKGHTLAEIIPMLMAAKDECLLESCSDQAVELCQKLTDQWGDLLPAEASEKRFKIYFDVLQKKIDDALAAFKR